MAHQDFSLRIPAFFLLRDQGIKQTGTHHHASTSCQLSTQNPPTWERVSSSPLSPDQHHPEGPDRLSLLDPFKLWGRLAQTRPSGDGCSLQRCRTRKTRRSGVALAGFLKSSGPWAGPWTIDDA
jgi:hypothetical protein